jgi:hypothetical protein
VADLTLDSWLPAALLLQLWWGFAPAALGCILLEACLLPHGRHLWRRPLAVWAGHLAVLLLVYVLELLMFQRPWFAASQLLFWQGLMLVVNRVKLAQLYEPFVYQDLHYFIDIFRHPRLYLPFFGLGRLIVSVALPFVLVAFAIQLEPALQHQWQWSQLIAGWLLLVALMLLVGLYSWLHVSPLVGVDPALDQAEMGMLGGFIAYAKAERQLARLAEPLQVSPSGPHQPHLVVVQSESFFDARKLWPQIKPECYQWFDELQQQSLYAGELAVPAIGANTLRSEFSFLTGLTNHQQGIHRFNPYRRLARQPVRTLASRLRAQGYRTVCVHPYPISFYQRDRVYPHLGFDEFIDRKAFTHQSNNHYVGDIEVAEKVQQILAQASGPVFVFVITMENHGPLHLEKVEVDEPAHYLSALPPAMVAELTAYLRHIANAGEMAKQLCQTLQQSDREGVLCWYGDHLPILPALYKACEYDSHLTDYLIWSTRPVSAQPRRRERPVDQLANLLLELQTSMSGEPGR